MATSSKSKKDLQRAWRPDFRDVQTLPDTKVIRTDFLLNFVGIAVAAICLTLYGFREYKLQNLVSAFNELEKQVERSTTDNRATLDINKKFLQGAEIVAEAVAFDNQAISYSAFIGEVTAALKEGMQLSTINLANSGELEGTSGIPPFHITMEGKILEDAPGTPANILSEFQDALLELESLSGKNVQMEMTRFNRNNKFGYFDFTLLLKIAVEKAPSL